MEEIFFVFVINFLGMALPGPDFLIVLRSSLIRSKSYVLRVVFGIGLGLAFHVLIMLLAVETLAKLSNLVFLCIQIVGSGYLLFLASKLLFPSKKEQAKMLELTSLEKNFDTLKEQGKPGIKEASLAREPFLGAFLEGFLCNILNVKAIFFFLSLFSQIVPATGLSQGLKLVYIIGIPLLGIAWFSWLAWVLYLPIFRKYMLRFQGTLMRVMGIFIVAFAFFTVYSTFF